MNRWIKWLVVFAAVLVAVAIGMAALTASNRGSGRSLVFADGTRVTLISAEVPAPSIAGPRGTSISMTQERYDGGWRDWLYPKLPRGMLAKLGVQPGAALGFNTNSMGIWLKFEDAPFSTLQHDFRIRVTDETGPESQNFYSYVTTRNNLAFFIIPNYPHRSHNVTVRVYHSDARHPGELAKGLTFILHNSAPATPPNWSPESMPATRATNGLEITLTSLQTGLSNLSLGSNSSFTTEGGRNYSRATFALRENGENATNWRLDSLRLTAATGDSLGGPSLRGWADSHYAAAFQGALWSEETAWEMMAEFQRTANFPPEELWVLKDIVLPPSDQPAEIASLADFHGVGAVRAAFTAPGRFKPVRSGAVNISVVLAHHPADVRLVLVEMSDGQGRGLSALRDGNEVTSGPADVTGYSYSIPVSTNATKINLTFAITKSRFATFRVKPAVAP